MPLCERRRAEASLLPRFGRRERPPQERGGLRGPGLHGQGGAAAGTRVGMRRPLLRGAQPAEPRALLLAPPPLGAALPGGEGDGAARAGRGLRRHRGRAVAAAAGAGRRQGAARGAHVDGQREAHLAACEHRGRHGGGAARRPAGGGGGGAIVGHFLREPRAPRRWFAVPACPSRYMDEKSWMRPPTRVPRAGRSVPCVPELARSYYVQ
mmetsp:Transcript_12571/g.40627  ORF Transcript_12571/g.40627 Transcript_12571/m.40627 type:complete len:209 (-) Transcript_12571:46-672(-)